MPIALAKNYINMLDEVYRMESVTSDLISPPSMMRAGANANEILYPQIDVSGLKDYSRASGYKDGSVSVVWKTAQFNYDRGTKIMVDTMDDEETFNIAFGMAGGTLQRDKVAPEADAFFFSTICQLDDVSAADAVEYADAAAFLAALIEANTVMDDDEVPSENRYLYATSALINSVMGLDTTKSREVLATFSKVVKVPTGRFYTKIDLLDGESEGEEAGHYSQAADGAALNFVIVHKPCLIKFDKHIASDVISPASNPDSDAYISKYRKYGLVDVYANKRAGIYYSAKPTESGS